MKNRFMKRGLSLLLAVAMMFGMIQAPLFTQEVEAASSSMLSLVETPTAGNDYAMVAKLSDGTYRALVNNSGTASTQEVTVSGTDATQLSLNGNASVDNLKWNLSVSGFTTDLGGYWIKNATQYLYLNFNDWTTIASGSDTSTTTANVEITTNATTAYRYVRLSGSASAHWNTDANLQNTVISVGGLEIYDVNNSALTYTADDIVVSGTSQDSGDQVSKSDVLTATATEFWSSEVRSATDKIAQGNPYFMVDLQTAQNIGKVNYIPRLAGSNNYNCVGRIYDYYVDASNGEQKAVLSTTSTECDLTAVADTTGAYYISAGNQKLAYDETAQAFTFNETGTPIYFYEVSEGSETIESITMGEKPANGTTQNQPFARGTAGSDKFRIPALITTKDGTLVAAIDARWNTHSDALGIDTIVSISADDGANWNYTFANYLGDYGNESTNPNSEKAYAATFIDPELIYDKNAGDKGTIYMLVDLYAGGYAINTAPMAPVSGNPFTDAGYLKLKASGASTYDYYLKDGKIYRTDGTEVSGYTVDGYFNLFYNDAEAGNLFFNSADQAKKPAYQVLPTTYLYLTKSTDNGATWSAPQLLDVKADDEYFYGVGPGRGIVTSDGTLMFSCYKYAGSEESQKASVIYSTDNGATWKRTQNATPSIWSSESQLVELPDGTIRMFFRNGQGCICYVDATKGTDADGNKVYTWGDYKTTSITNRSNCQLSAMMYSKKIDGKDAILVACPSNTSSRSEGKIFVALLNSDNSMEWKYNYAGFGTGYFQYSCMTELTDGSIGILYEDCSTSDGSAVYKKIAITDIVGAATIGGFWVKDVTGNVVTDVTMKPGSTASYSIFGETSGDLTVASSDTSVATVALNETATAAADDTAVATFTVTANADLVGYGTSTITVSDGTESTSFKVEVVSGDTDNYEKVTLRVGETYEAEGKLINQEDGQNILSVEKKMLAPYVLADTIESGESYLIQSAVDSNKYVGYLQGETTSSGTTVSGLALGKENNEDLNSTDYHNYAWTITGSEENGYTIQNAEGNYMAIGAASGDHASVTLSTDSVNLKIYKNTRTDQYAGAYGISNSGNTKHLNNASDGYAIAYKNDCNAGARSNWKLYKSTNAKVVLTAETVGQTVMEIGDTTYYFTVIDDDPVKSYSLTVGEVAPVIVSGELSGYDEAEKAIAKIEVVDGNMTIEGLAAGYVQIEVGAVTYNIVVAPKAEGFPIVAESGSGYTDLAAGEALKVVTKLTISDNNEFNLGVNEGTIVTWTSGDTNILTVDADGVITCNDVTTTVITTVTATVDGVDYTIPVIVHPGPTNGNKLVDIYIDEISNLNVYYSWNCSTDLVHACTGEAIYYSTNVDDPIAIDFMSAPKDGYALTYMAATNGQGHYMTVHTGDDATLDESAKGFLNYVGSDGAAGAGVTQKALFTEEQVKAMLYAGIVRHCDGAMGFTRTSNATGQIASSLTFQAEKLPTIEKSVHGILPADARRPGYRTYEDGMAATEGEFVYFQITLKTYRPLTFKEGTTQSMINYDAAVLTDDVLEGASFITDKGQETVLTPDQIIPSPVITTIEDIEDALNAQEWADGEVTKELTYYVAYKITADDIGSTLKNTAELSYDYQAQYSTGGYSAAANAEAQLTVADYIEKELVVDFGLPVSMTLPTWGKVVKTEGDANAQSDYDVIRLKTGSGENVATATYGTVAVAEVFNTAGDTTTGWKITYTPTETLKAVDVITVYSSNVTDEAGNPAAYTIKVYPASSVYYEEKFMDTSKDTDGDTTNSEWTIAGTVITAEQESAQPGYTTALENWTANYGYDAVYAEPSNSEAVTAKTTDGKEKAAFKFTGTGVDVFANCDADTGIVMVMVKQLGTDGTSTLKKMFTVDTKLNFGTIDNANAATLGSQTLNVPIVSISEHGLDYGDYEVLLVHAPKKVKTQTTVDGVVTETTTAVETDLRIDGFRVYGTLQDPDAAIVHGKDYEAAPVYLDMKDSILAGMSISDAWDENAGENKTAYAEQLAGNLLSQIYASSGAKLAGAVVTAADSTTLAYSGADLKDFLDNTSKNELYLYPGQSLVFALDFATMNPQLALKALNGAGEYKITKAETGNASATPETVTKELKANTEMYYLLGMLKNADKTQLATTFTISNTGTSVVSVTKLKVITGTAVETFVELSAEDLVPAFSVVKNGDAGEKENVVRIAGEDRYETAYLVAEEYKEVLGVEKFDAVIVATGKNFADALSGSYLASVKNAPILLTNGKEDNVAQLHAYIKDNVAEGGVVYILGGTAAVPESVEAIEGYDPVRLAGETRYETNLAILDEAGLDNSELLIATGRTFADSLSASALKKPIMLVKDEVTENQEAVLAQYIGGRICIIGGTGAVSEDIENALAQYGTVRRVYGQTRYETSIAVADEFFRQTGMAVIANAQVFPDGLCGGPLAGALNAPLILTADGKTADAAAYMQDKSLQNGIVLGGDARISDDSVGTIFGISE